MEGHLTGSVLVTDGEQRSALAIVRSLGAAGYRVIVAGGQPLPLATASRYCSRRIRTHDPARNPDAFVAAIERACQVERADWLIPVTEAALRALLPVRDQLSARLPFPSIETFNAVSDKAILLKTAASLGIDVPRQVLAMTAADTKAADSIGFPLVAKPSRSVAEGHQFSVGYAGNAEELEILLTNLPKAAYPVLLQERVEGPGTGIFLLVWGGMLRAVFAHRRIREKPPSGGVSVVAESVSADPALVIESRQLLDAFGWEGAAMVEYKRDLRTGRTVLMEVNGRFWGSLQLAIDSGVDFPRLLLACADGDGPSAPAPYTTGVRNRWWWGDVDHTIMRLWRSRRALHLPSDAPGRLGAIRAFLGESGRNEVLRASDFGPAAWETINWLLRR